MENQALQEIFYLVFALLIAITVHEFCHALAAYFLGDSTAKDMGRLTLNPLAHLDPIGTLMVFLVRFGLGKPVPVNPNNFKNPKTGYALVSLAGPMSNYILAILFSGLWHLTAAAKPGFGFFISIIIFLNLVLGTFNLLPIPPLDGSKFVYPFLPKNFDILKFERIGPLILLGIIIADFWFGIPIIRGTILPIIELFLRVLGIPSLI